MTLLLASDVLRHLERLLSAGGTRRSIVRHLVHVHAISLARMPRHLAPRTLYQSAEDLSRLNVKLGVLTWARIQLLARSLGISACYAVDLILRLDAGLIAKDGVPTRGRPIPWRRNTRISLRVSFEIDMMESDFTCESRLAQRIVDRRQSSRLAALRAHRKFILGKIKKHGNGTGDKK